MQNIGSNIIAVIASIIGLAMLAVLVSRNAQTPQVISATTRGLSDLIGTAVSPVTGSTRSLGGSGIN